MKTPHLFTLALIVVLSAVTVLGLKSGFIYQSSLSFRRYEAMAALIQMSNERAQSLQHEVATLKSGQASPDVPKDVIAHLQAGIKTAKREAGLTPLSGRGITLWLSDSPILLQEGTDQEAYLIHDIDLLMIVNSLNRGGAKAISINGQRLVAMSQIRCAGPVISINGVRTAPPITITAIGDPTSLTKGLQGATSILNVLKAYDIPVSLTTGQHLTVPAYTPQPKEGL